MKIVETKLKLTDTQSYLASRAIKESVVLFYQNSENEARFQEWLRLRSEDNEGNKASNKK